MWEIRIEREEIKEMMKKLDERKTIGPDGVSGYILKDDVIECSIKTGKVLKDWKRADIMPIYEKWKKRRTT